MHTVNILPVHTLAPMYASTRWLDVLCSSFVLDDQFVLPLGFFQFRLFVFDMQYVYIMHTKYCFHYC